MFFFSTIQHGDPVTHTCILFFFSFFSFFSSSSFFFFFVLTKSFHSNSKATDLARGWASGVEVGGQEKVLLFICDVNTWP